MEHLSHADAVRVVVGYAAGLAIIVLTVTVGMFFINRSLYPKKKS